MANVLIVVSRFNDLITKSLLDAAKTELLSQGITEDKIEVLWTPGAFEIPGLAAKALSHTTYESVICLGAVIKGETPHFDYICSAVSSSLSRLSVESKCPVIFGILTTDTVEQAMNRAGLKHGNKGSEAARAALEMMRTYKKFDNQGRNF
ncbi:MAG: 6,7-dimethyl-8-ribityllumazine synthase [Oligoflexales bacterium]